MKICVFDESLMEFIDSGLFCEMLKDGKIVDCFNSLF